MDNRCLARTRSGHPCKKWKETGRKRCRFHGGLSTGIRTVEGRARQLKALVRHGYWTNAWREFRESERARLQEEWGPCVRVSVRLLMTPGNSWQPNSNTQPKPTASADDSQIRNLVEAAEGA